MRSIIQIISLSFFCLSIACAEEPWGKDADLVQPKNGHPSKLSTFKPSLPSLLLISIIRFHQTVLTHADGPRSHFVPCSSQYTLLAIKKYGPFCGILMGFDRLIRENNDPWLYSTIHTNDGLYSYDPP